MNLNKLTYCFIFFTIFIINASLANAQKNINKSHTIKFVSFPDFFNFDIPNPWQGYDSAVNYFLTQVKSENPDFVLIAGDLVNGHWWNGPKCVEHMGGIYYPAWIKRMEQFGLTYYTAIGDHELGDDPWPESKRKLVPHFERVYNNYLKMPQNGPESKKGLSYFVRKGNLLLITVETFEIVDDTMFVDVRGEQIEWLKKILKDNTDASFKIVQGHTPIWGDIKCRSCSYLKIDKGKESEFYKVLIDNKVDLYLCGEFHDVTILQSDGLWQIVHGSSWGREIVNTQDYLVGEISDNEMKLTMKRIYMDAQGEYMWNLNKDKGPRELVHINNRTLKNGPEITGTLTIIKKNNEKNFINISGLFMQ
jgi:hypothetical protein